MSIVPGTLQLVKRQLIAGTDRVLLDELCWSLKEVNLPRPDSKGVHRYMVIKVVRNDRVVEYRRDLGPADNFKVGEIAIPGGVVDLATGRGEILHTVGELLDIAEYYRRGDLPDPEHPDPSDLIGAYYDLPDQAERERKRLSVMGPQVRVQRG